MIVKRIKKVSVNNTLFIKFFLSVLLISVISVVLLTSLIFYWLQGKTNDDINKINEIELLNTEAVFNSYIGIYQNFAMELFQNLTIKSVMLSGDTEWSDSFSYAASNVKSIISVNKAINSIYIYGADRNIFYVANKTESKQSQEELFKQLRNNSVMMSPIVWDMHAINGDVIHTMTVFFHDGLPGKSGFDGAIAVNIDLDELKKNIFSGKTDGSHRVIIVNNNGVAVMQSGKSNESINLDLLNFNRILTSKETAGIFDASLNKTNTSVQYITSKDRKFYIIMEMDRLKSNSELIKGRNVLLTVSLGMIILIAVISFAVAYIVYRPLRTVFNNIKNFFYDTAAKDKRMNEIQLISNILAKTAERLNSLEKESTNNAAVRILTSDITYRDQVATSTGQIINTAALIDPGTNYLVIILRIDEFMSSIDKSTTAAMDFQMDAISTISVEFFRDMASCSAYRTADDCITLIVSNSEPSSSLNDVNMKDLQGIIKRMLNMEVTVGVSLIAVESQELNEKYREALLLTKYRVLYGGGNVFQAKLMNRMETGDVSDKDLEPVINAVKNCSFDEFNSALENLIVLSRKYGYEKAVKALSKLAVTIIELPNAVVNEQNHNKSSNYLDVYKKASELTDLDELRNWFTQLYNEASAVINDVKRKKVHDIIIDAIDYIGKHYWEQQLSINSMAERISISPGHFSRLFNEVTGCSFPDYVNHLRLDKAKDMLIEYIDEEITEIARKTGYSSSTYFTTSFKKKFGMTPSKWRIHHKSIID